MKVIRNAAKWVAIGAAVGTALAIGGLVIAPAIAGVTTASATAAAAQHQLRALLPPQWVPAFLPEH